MYAIVDFVFRNIFFIVIIVIIYYIVKQYLWLKEKEKQINIRFDNVLNSYLSKKIEESKAIVDYLNNLYQVEEVKLELDKIYVILNKGVSGTINEKVETSNSLNKYKLAKNLSLEKYPELNKLNKIGTFIEADMESLANGVAIARKEYNTLAFLYNEKASSFFLQYLTKLLHLTQSYTIFDAPKSQAYEDKYEVFEEKEPELNSISSLNQTQNNPLHQANNTPNTLENNNSINQNNNLNNE